jgi:hypothetical protein
MSAGPGMREAVLSSRGRVCRFCACPKNAPLPVRRLLFKPDTPLLSRKESLTSLPPLLKGDGFRQSSVSKRPTRLCCRCVRERKRSFARQEEYPSLALPEHACIQKYSRASKQGKTRRDSSQADLLRLTKSWHQLTSQRT